LLTAIDSEQLEIAEWLVKNPTVWQTLTPMEVGEALSKSFKSKKLELTAAIVEQIEEDSDLKREANIRKKIEKALENGEEFSCIQIALEKIKVVDEDLLICAAKGGDVNSVRWIIEAGVNVNFANDRGESAFAIAWEYCDTELMNYLESVEGFIRPVELPPPLTSVEVQRARYFKKHQREMP
jgi:hypothetical protein